MKIQKDHIVIRDATIDDAILLNTWWNDGAVMEHAGFPLGLGESLAETLANIQKRDSIMNPLCIIKIDGQRVGELNYHLTQEGIAYPGWKICDVGFQNQGYGPKIILLLFEYLFTNELINTKIKVEKVVWDTTLENGRAQYVYEQKIGAKRIGVRERAWQDQLGRWRTVVDYQMTREEFLALYKQES